MRNTSICVPSTYCSNQVPTKIIENLFPLQEDDREQGPATVGDYQRPAARQSGASQLSHQQQLRGGRSFPEVHSIIVHELMSCALCRTEDPKISPELDFDLSLFPNGPVSCVTVTILESCTCFKK